MTICAAMLAAHTLTAKELNFNIKLTPQSVEKHARTFQERESSPGKTGKRVVPLERGCPVGRSPCTWNCDHHDYGPVECRHINPDGAPEKNGDTLYCWRTCRNCKHKTHAGFK